MGVMVVVVVVGGGCVSVCVLGGRSEGGGRGGSYLFVLPSRRVREQIKGFSSQGQGARGPGGGLCGGTDFSSSYIPG